MMSEASGDSVQEAECEDKPCSSEDVIQTETSKQCSQETLSAQIQIETVSRHPLEDNDDLKAKVGAGGEGSSTLSRKEPFSSLVPKEQKEEQYPTATANYSSPMSQSFTDVSTLSYSKDIKDSNASQGSCGLYNLGNTCFMNAGLQCLLSNGPLVRYFLSSFSLDDSNRHTLLGQYFKLLCKVWCGRFSVVHPREFKETLGMYHSQFQDYRQHDCQEFLALLLDTFHEHLNSAQSKLTPVSNNIASGGISATQSSEPLSTSLNNQECSPCSEPLDGAQASDSVSSTNSQSKHSVLNESQLQTEEPVTHSPNESTNTGVNNSTIFASEDSNQSSVSVHSTDSDPSLNIKKLHLQSSGDLPKAEDDVAVTTSNNDSPLVDRNNQRSTVAPKSSHSNTSVLNLTTNTPPVDARTDYNLMQSKSDNLAQLNNVCSPKLPPSLLDYYGKETKTLNTNVLLLNSSGGEMSSEKFAKQDNRNRPVEEEMNILQEVLGEEAKVEKDFDPISFGIKDTNLRVEKKSRFLSKSCPNVLDSDNTQDVYQLNNIKRIKIDSAEPTKSVQDIESEKNVTIQAESEKNVQIQAMSKFNTRKVLQDEASDGDSSAESMEAEDAESSEEEGEVTSRSSSVNAVSMEASFVNNRAEIYQEAADLAWNKYLQRNNSVIISTFQGQFQSTVVCSVCSHVSVTYEPFMYLSLPIPRAMERQICVILISRGEAPTRYLLNMHKNDKVHQLKKELQRLIQQPNCDIILAEVLNSHVSRVLDDNVMLRYVNDTSRKIYAFEMVQPTLPIEEASPEKEMTSLPSMTSSLPTQSSVPRPSSETMTSSEAMTDSSDIFSNMGTFGGRDNMFSVNTQKDTMCGDIDMGDAFEAKETRHMTSPEPSYMEADSEKESSDMAGTGLWEWSQRFSECGSWDTIGDGPTLNPPPLPRDVVNSVTGIADQWRTCAICLEELSDNDLLTHHSCSGTFCQNCLEMSVKHSNEAGYCCPICLMPANMMEDFSPLVSASSHKPQLRVIPIPIAFRCDLKDETMTSEKLFGHPSVMYMPNRLPGESLYEMIDSVMSFPAMYSVVLTDGQGLRCSRCMYTSHCTGCVLCREGEVTLQPGDNITVHVMDMPAEWEEQAGASIDHTSMKDLRPNEPITLNDCFKAFTKSEVLDENNPWYCPQCQQNQCAKKTMTVWRYPDSLILHLKRFVFHELSSTKVDNQVVFPHKDLDLQNFLSGPKVKDLNYDLFSIVCHFGGSHSGHYTSYTHHPLTSEWHYNNDETVIKQEPKDDDYSSAYVLFYQRRGTTCKFQPPSGEQLEDEPTPVEPSEPTLIHTCSLPPWMSGAPEEGVVTASHSIVPKEDKPVTENSFDFYS